MRLPRTSILIEGLVALVVIVVLLITMIPHVRTAHVQLQVVKTLTVLKGLSEGMAAYQIDSGIQAFAAFARVTTVSNRSRP